MTPLARAVGDAPFVFVVGKGGVGKTTTAGALALELADAGHATHLISTDPAHSLGDLFEAAIAGVQPSPCTPALLLEEFAAASYADRWLARTAPLVAGIVEGGTLLDAEDVAGFTRLALPGVDELMAALRLVDLLEAGARVVVDTAPTGHTLRLLEAAATYRTLARALDAMAEKAATVASSLTGRRVRLEGESVIEELDAAAAAYRERVLGRAAFVLVTRAGAVVHAETVRLAGALRARGLRLAALVQHGAAPPDVVCDVVVHVPVLADPRGCGGLRRWRAALDGGQPPGPPAAVPAAGAGADAAGGESWLRHAATRLLVFAGKGGVGKTTCAAAAAVVLAGTRDVLLCSADPAGSLEDVLAGEPRPARLRTLQVDAEARLRRLREEHRAELFDALEAVGVGESAVLDRRVIDALWDLAPPGIDEFAALADILDAAGSSETIVLDTAPTGHFVRLLAMPQLALDWTRQLMRLLVKYRAAGVAGGAAEALLRTARELRALQDLLHDAASTGVVVVTLDEPLVRAETERLLTRLREADVPVAGTLMNRVSGADRPAAGAVVAPEMEPPPVGARALRDFVAAWKIPA